MLITLSEAAALLERRHGKKVHRKTIKGYGELRYFALYNVSGWKVDETEFTAWAARAGRLRQTNPKPVDLSKMEAMASSRKKPKVSN